MLITPVPSGLPFQASTGRIIAVTSEKSDLLPGVPTMRETGPELTVAVAILPGAGRTPKPS